MTFERSASSTKGLERVLTVFEDMKSKRVVCYAASCGCVILGASCSCVILGDLGSQVRSRRPNEPGRRRLILYNVK